jgi:type I restriction enzyme S subunit
MGTSNDQIRLADVCKSIDYGYTDSASNVPIGPKFLRITDIVKGYINWGNVPHCNVTDEIKRKYQLHHGDIVIARTGATTGASAYISNPPEAIFASYLVRLKLAESVEPRFISYFLHSSDFWDYIRGVLGDKSAQPNASARTMTQAKLRFPPLAEQQAIAHILGTLDDKIELNRRMNETLEAMARVLFKSWFVDFDPVRAKAEKRQPAGMSLETAALFPLSFEESLLGQIPQGWHVGPLRKLAEVVMGLSPKGETYNDVGNGSPLVNGPVEFGDFFPIKSKWTTTPTRLSKEGDLIFCVRGSTTGRRVVADDVYCLGRGVCAIRAIHDNQAFVNQTIDFNLERLLAKTTGSVFPNLSAPDIKGFEVLIPQESQIDRYCEMTQPLKQKIWLNVAESQTLGTLRNVLLPKLLSGDIRVREAEREVEQVA